MNIAFGIDLGTTRSSIALVTPRQPERGWYGSTEVLQLADGVVTPSAVLFDPRTVIVGANAKNMGHRSADCAQIFKREMPRLDYFFEPSCRSGERYSAEDLSQIVLTHITEQASERCGLPVEQVVITVPAYFGGVERRRTRQAGEKAGLQVLDIINEPTAAILAYLFQPGAEQLREPVLVFDLGGGTFDTVVVDVQDYFIQVAAIDGDLLLGGRDFDSTIAFELSSRFIDQYPGATPPAADPDANTRLTLEVERARESLSAVTTANIPVWGGGADSNRAYNAELTRSDLESLLEVQLERCIDIAGRALTTARQGGVVPTRVLFVGGATKMPALRERVLREFGLAELKAGADPDLLVAKGAAIWAQKLLFDEAAREALGCTSLAGINWDATDVRAVVTRLARASNFSRELLMRLLQIQLQSITSRGYAIHCYSRETGEYFLLYLVQAQEKLPFFGKPTSFIWNSDIYSWNLEVYEDSAAHRATQNPDLAKLVERVTGETHRHWPEGSKFYITFDITPDQIIHMHAWHQDGDAPGGELRTVIDPNKTDRSQISGRVC